MKGYITKGIGGFYYVKTPEGIVECKPRGIFRKQKITPVAGDEVTLETENGAAVIAEIAPRKNVFVRPPVANLDVLFLVASTTQPTPSTLVLDKLAAIAVDKGVQPVIVCTKGDLAEAEFLRKAYERSTLPFIRIDYETGGGLDEVIADHQNIITAIERCDLAAFEPLVERHLYGGIRRLGSKLTGEYADYFEPEK